MFSRSHRKLAFSGYRLGVFALLIAFVSIAIAPAPTRADDAQLMQRVKTALKANRQLNGAAAYTASPGVIVLYGTVFDDSARVLAESTARKVKGVTKVINTLQTSTGQWLEQEVRINDTLQLNGFPGIRAKVIGPEVYLSGLVSSDQGASGRATAGATMVASVGRQCRSEKLHFRNGIICKKSADQASNWVSGYFAHQGWISAADVQKAQFEYSPS
jgi:BON domain